jgi:hypothetical protein
VGVRRMYRVSGSDFAVPVTTVDAMMRPRERIYAWTDLVVQDDEVRFARSYNSRSMGRCVRCDRTILSGALARLSDSWLLTHRSDTCERSRQLELLRMLHIRGQLSTPHGCRGVAQSP